MFKNTFFSLIAMAAFSVANAGTYLSLPVLPYTISKDSSRMFKEEYLEILKDMNPSMQGTTQKGIKYSLYAIKKGRDWNFLILDSTDYYSVFKDKKNEEMVENPQNYTEMLCLLAKGNLLKRKNKARNVSSLTLSCYYALRPKAKRVYISYKKIRRDFEFIQKNLKNGKKGKEKILDKALK